MRFGNQKREAVTDRVTLDLAIDETNLNKEIMDQPLLYKKYSDLDAEAQSAVRLAELQLDQVKARAHLKYSNEGMKRKVAEVDAMVSVDAAVLEAKGNVIRLQEQADKIRGALKAAWQRHESLRELSTNKRKELSD